MDDLDLVKDILNGNLNSFNLIIYKYEASIFKFILTMVKNSEEAKDLTQEVFITVYNKLYTFNKDYKFSNWLFQIARNKCIDYIRKYKRVYESNVEDSNAISKEVSPEQFAEFKETKKMVEEFIATLNEVDKHIITLKYSDDSVTFGDISDILNMSESSVKRRYYKARERFKEYLVIKEKRCK